MQDFFMNKRTLIFFHLVIIALLLIVIYLWTGHALRWGREAERVENKPLSHILSGRTIVVSEGNTWTANRRTIKGKVYYEPEKLITEGLK